MQKILAAAALCLLTAPTFADSCECLWQGSFAQSQAAADLVVTGEVRARRGNSFDIAIDRELRGQTWQERIRVWGEYAGTCRAPLEAFVPGTRWVLALTQIESVPAGGFDPATPSISYGREGDYALSRCGANWLAYKPPVVSGNLVDGARWQYGDEDANPVLLGLLEDFLAGDIGADTLAEAAAPREEVRDLMRQTRSFIRE